MAELYWLKRPIAHRGLHDAAKGIVENSASSVRAAMGAGLVISIFQAATQVNEQTLTFVPKIVIVLGLFAVAVGGDGRVSVGLTATVTGAVGGAGDGVGVKGGAAVGLPGPAAWLGTGVGSPGICRISAQAERKRERKKKSV